MNTNGCACMGARTATKQLICFLSIEQKNTTWIDEDNQNMPVSTLLSRFNQRKLKP